MPADQRITPKVLAEAEDPHAQLTVNPEAYQQQWDTTQAGGDVCLVKMVLTGAAGPVKLMIR